MLLFWGSGCYWSLKIRFEDHLLVSLGLYYAYPGNSKLSSLEYIFDIFVGPKLFPMISNKVSMIWHYLGNLYDDIYRVFPITMGSLGNWIEPIPLKTPFVDDKSSFLSGKSCLGGKSTL